jgi:hypothetical protein
VSYNYYHELSCTSIGTQQRKMVKMPSFFYWTISSKTLLFVGRIAYVQASAFSRDGDRNKIIKFDFQNRFPTRPRAVYIARMIHFCIRTIDNPSPALSCRIKRHYRVILSFTESRF